MKRKLTRDDVEITLSVIPEIASIRGNILATGNDEIDRNYEARIENDLNNGNKWAWCEVRVTARWKGLEKSDYLGCCSYNSREDFIRNDGYYDDMISLCLQRLNENLQEIFTALNKL